MVIEIFFDKSLQGATVRANSVRVVRSVSGGPAGLWPGTITYDDAAKSARFTPHQPFGTETDQPCARVYTLTLFGDGPDWILNVEGLALDGDGSPGGNFTSTFTVHHLLV